MMSSEYAFVTHWHLHRPIERVWEEIFHAERWPRWWKGLERVEELEPGDAHRVGCVRRFVWKGRLPYMLVVDMQVTRVEPPILLESLAHGELEGQGIWRLTQQGEDTDVRCEWTVRTTKRWMKLIAPLARPVFSWNHNVVMRWGEQGLKRLLEGAA